MLMCMCISQGVHILCVAWPARCVPLPTREVSVVRVAIGTGVANGVPWSTFVGSVHQVREV